MSVYDVLAERGFLKQVSHEEKSVNFLKRRKSRFILALTRQLTACMSATLLL